MESRGIIQHIKNAHEHMEYAYTALQKLLSKESSEESEDTRAIPQEVETEEGSQAINGNIPSNFDIADDIMKLANFPSALSEQIFF